MIPLSTAIIILKALIDIIAILQSITEVFARVLARMSAKFSLKDVRGEQDPFLTFQSR